MTRKVVAGSGPSTLVTVRVKLMTSPEMAVAGPALVMERLAPLMTVVFLTSASLPGLASTLPAALMLAVVEATPAVAPTPRNWVVQTACAARLARVQVSNFGLPARLKAQLVGATEPVKSMLPGSWTSRVRVLTVVATSLLVTSTVNVEMPPRVAGSGVQV